MRRWPDARRFALHAGGGANGGDGRIAARDPAGAGTRARRRAAGRRDRRAARHRAEGSAAGGDVAPDRADQRSRRPGARGRHPVRRERVHGRGRWPAVNADVTVTMHGPKVGLAVAPGRFHAGRGSRRGHRPRAGGDRAPARHGGDPGRGAASLGARQQVHGRPCPRRRRIARDDRRSGARRSRSASRRRRLRDDRRAGRVASRPRDARAGGGEATARGRLRRGGKGEGARRRAWPGA